MMHKFGIRKMKGLPHTHKNIVTEDIFASRNETGRLSVSNGKTLYIHNCQLKEVSCYTKNGKTGPWIKNKTVQTTLLREWSTENNYKAGALK